MKHVLVGQIADATGHAMRSGLYTREFLQLPSTNYRARQQHVPVTVDHGRTIGRLEHAEWTRDSRLLAVAVVDANIIAVGDWYLSPTVKYTGRGDNIELVEVAVTQDPATIAARPIWTRAGDLNLLHRRRDLDPEKRELLERSCWSSRSSGIMIRTVDQHRKLGQPISPVAAQQLEHQPGRGRGPVRWSAPYPGSIISVR